MTTTTTTKASKPLVPCWCGCGGTTKSRFVPGHDARFHGWAKKVARGQLEGHVVLAGLPHEDAKDEFSRHVDKEQDRLETLAAAAEAEKAEPVAEAEAPTTEATELVAA